MKIKLELEQKKYEGNVEEVSVGQRLPQAQGEPEVFLPEDGKKRWLQNPETAVYHGGTDWINKLDRSMTVDELNEKYPTGETLNAIGEPKRAREIYYPSEEIPTIFEDIMGLLTLEPVPSIKQFNDIGFNLIMPFSSNVPAKTLGASGIPMIVNGSANTWGDEKRYNVVGYFLWDMPEVKKILPEKVIEVAESRRKNTDLPIGCIFTSGFLHEKRDGWNEKWQDVIKALDFAAIIGYFDQQGQSPWQPRVDSVNEAIREIRKLGVPVLGISQGFESVKYKCQRPDFDFAAKFWRDRNMGWVWYSWKCHDLSLGSSSWYDSEAKRIIKEVI